MRKYEVIMLNSFKRDYKTVYKRGYNMKLLQEIVENSQTEKPYRKKSQSHSYE